MHQTNDMQEREQLCNSVLCIAVCVFDMSTFMEALN